MLRHTNAKEYVYGLKFKCTGENGNCVFLPYNPNGKFRDEVYDLIWNQQMKFYGYPIVTLV